MNIVMQLSRYLIVLMLQVPLVALLILPALFNYILSGTERNRTERMEETKHNKKSILIQNEVYKIRTYIPIKKDKKERKEGRIERKNDDY